MKNIENQGSLTTTDAMGRSGPVKTPSSFPITNEINGFAHIFYGTALKQRFNVCRLAKNWLCVLSLAVLAFSSTGTVFADPHDGTGTMTVSPSRVVPGSTGNSFIFSFRDETLGIFPANSVVTITVPSGWTAPQTTSASSPGYISYTLVGDTVNSITVIGSGPWVVTINFNGINPASGFDVTYAGGGTKVTAPASLGIYTFTTRSQGGSGGTLTAIAASPTITANDDLVVTLPGQVFTSGVGNTGVVSNQTAGVAFNLTLYAVGVGGNVRDLTYSGFKTITFSGPSTAASGTAPLYTANVTFNNGLATGIATTLTAAETTTITAAATDGTANGVASSSLTVVAGTMDHYGLSAASPQNATEAFPLTVTAQDAFNNPVTANSPTPVTLGSSTGHATFGSNPITLVNGVFTVSATVSTAETVNLTATDTNGKAGTLIGLVVNPAPASGDYRSAASGNWNDNTTWQTFNGLIWMAATSTPTSQKVTIESGHTVDVTRRVTVNQVIVQFGGIITNAQNLRLGGGGTALDIFGTVNAEGIQTAANGQLDTTTNWPLAASTTTIVENGGSLAVNGGNLKVDGTLLVAGGTVTTTAGDNLSGSGTLTISNGTVTVGAPGQSNDCSVNTVSMTGGLLILGRGFTSNTENLTGGTVQFAATQTGFQIPQTTYANVILSGTTMNLNLGNGNIVITGNLSITGTTVVSVRKPLTAQSLTLGGTGVGAGTWGGTGSGAANINTTYFLPATPGDYITVTSAAAAELIVTLPNQTFTSGTGNSGSVTNQVAGISFNITLTAVDANSNIDTTYSGFKTITYSGPANSPNGTAPSYTESVTFNNGLATGIATTLTAAETTTITAAVADGTVNGVASSSLTVSFTTANAYRITDAASGTPTAGVGDQLTINLADQYGNTVTSFGGDKTLTFSGLSAADDGTLPTVTDKTGTAVNEGTSEAITFTAGLSSAGGSLVAYKAETKTLNVTDSGSLSSTSTGGAGASLTIANVAPVAADMAVTRTPGTGVAVAKTNQLFSLWSDANHDVITLAGVSSTSTNSVTVVSNRIFIIYPSSAPNVNDQISYTIGDGHGGIGAGKINITMSVFVTGQPGTIVSPGNPAQVKFYGIAGYTYVTQRSTNMVDYVNIHTNTVDSGGHPFTVSDDFSDLGGIPPSSAYYRLMWQP
jgi:Cadherin-like domain